MRERNTRRRLWAAALLVFAALCLPLEVRGSVVVPMSLTQLVEHADLIVDATVTDVRAVEGPAGIERIVQLRVGSTWKGFTDTVVYVRLAGGQMGRTETRVVGVPALAEGDRLAWFLVAHPRGGYSVVGLYQGALRTVPGVDGQPRVLAPTATTTARGDVMRVPRPLGDLAGDVRAIASGAGQ